MSVLIDSASHYASTAPVYISPTVHNHENTGDQDNDIQLDENLKENVEYDSSLDSSDEFTSIAHAFIALFLMNYCVAGVPCLVCPTHNT